MISAIQLKSAFKKWAMCLLLLAIFHSQGWAQVGPPPVILTQPISLTVPNGGTAVFTVVVSSVTTVSYQWFHNGSSIKNATSSVLTLNNIGSWDAGSYSVKVTNATGSVMSSNATLQVLNNPPVSTNDTYTTLEDVPLIIASWRGVLANDVDADGDTLTAVLVGNVTHGTLALNPNGGFTYLSATNYNGSDAFTYRANDGTINGNLATVTINITPMNDPPVAVNDTYTTLQDVQLTIAAPGILANDTDVEGDPLTAVLVGNVTHGTLALNPNGGFTYLSATNYNGSDSFTYRANDGTTNGNLATVTIN